MLPYESGCAGDENVHWRGFCTRWRVVYKGVACIANTTPGAYMLREIWFGLRSKHTPRQQFARRQFCERPSCERASCERPSCERVTGFLWNDGSTVILNEVKDLSLFLARSFGCAQDDSSLIGEILRLRFLRLPSVASFDSLRSLRTAGQAGC